MNKHQEHSRSFRLRDPPERWHSSIAAQIDSYSKQFQNKSCNLKKKKIQTQNHNINHLYDQQKTGTMKKVFILMNINPGLQGVRDRAEEEKQTNNKFKSQHPQIQCWLGTPGILSSIPVRGTTEKFRAWFYGDHAPSPREEYQHY